MSSSSIFTWRPMIAAKNRRRISAFFACALAALGAALSPHMSRAAADEQLQGFGIVYLHGKASWPGAMNGGILSALRDEGALIATPEMPWSFHRRYAATYDQAMAEIDAAVAELKAKGARRIVVIGHSLGANAAIGYAARRRGMTELAGIVALSPAHLPEVGDMRELCRRRGGACKKARRRGQRRRAADVSRYGPGHPSDRACDADRLS